MAKQIDINVNVMDKSIIDLREKLKLLNAELENTHSKKSFDNLKTSISQTEKELKNLTGTAKESSAGFGKLAGAVGLGVSAYDLASQAIGKFIQIGKDSLKLAKDEEDFQTRLNFALGYNQKLIEDTIKMRNKFNQNPLFTKEEINTAILYANSMGRTKEETDKLVHAAMGLSRVQRVDLQLAMDQLNKTYEGTKGKLSKYSAEIKHMTDEQLANGEAIDIINKKLGDFGDVAGELTTSTGRLEKSFNKFKETLGNLLTGPATMFLTVINAILKGEDIYTALITARTLRWIDEEKSLQNATKTQALFNAQVADYITLDSKSTLNQKKAKKEVDEINEKLKKGDISYTEAIVKRHDIVEKYQKLDELSAPKREKDAEDAAKHRQKLNKEESKSIHDRIEKEVKEAAAADEQRIKDEIKAKAAHDKVEQDIVDAADRKYWEDWDNWLKAQEKKDKKQKEIEKNINEIEGGAENIAQNVIGSVFDSLMNETEKSLQHTLDSIDKMTSKTQSNLEKLNKNRFISDANYQKQKDKLDKDKLEKENAAKKDAAKKEKQYAEEQSIINAFMGAGAALAKVPWTDNILMASIALATGLADAAIIASKPLEYKFGTSKVPNFASGGFTSPFGDPSGIPAILHPNEGVANASAMSIPGMTNLINAANSGQQLQTTTQLHPDSINAIINGINNKQVHVLESDITQVQTRVKVLQSRSSF